MALKELNEEIREIAKKAIPSVLEVRARRRGPSTGVAWSEDGLVVAADHTLEEEDGFEVATASGETYRASVVGRDPSTDVALLRAEKARLPVPRWGESASLEAGALALVVAASRLGRKVTLTTASLVGKGWNAESGARVDRYIETDGRLFPGFSGSLLLDVEGKGIGILTAGLRRRAALAIPIETLRRVTRSLLDHGEVKRGFLGITSYPVRLPPTVTSQRVGLLVLSVQDGSPAAEAGLFLGDVILTAEGAVIDSPTALLSHLGEDRIGKSVSIGILRAGRQESIPVTVAERGER
jgi:S1-C subfamily serine protease